MEFTIDELVGREVLKQLLEHLGNHGLGFLVLLLVIEPLLDQRLEKHLLVILREEGHELTQVWEQFHPDLINVAE